VQPAGPGKKAGAILISLRGGWRPVSAGKGPACLENTWGRFSRDDLGPTVREANRGQGRGGASRGRAWRHLFHDAPGAAGKGAWRP